MHMNQPQAHTHPLPHEAPPHPLGCHRASGCAPCATQRLPISLVVHVVTCVSQGCSLNSSHPLLPPLCPQACSLCLRLYSCPANRFTSTIFLNSYIYALIHNIFPWLTSLCITGSRFIHLTRTDSNSFLFMTNIPLYICTHLYPFIYQWTSRLLLCPSYCKKCYNEHWGMCVFSNYGFLRVHGQ